ncbi:MAG TPA: hypothetical protein VMS71_01010, partial [Candidatus Acidoferrum sp.]|nr:hypothetical protein [Candidatus Acidoferrum sp.]
YATWPIWNPDGSKVIFTSDRASGHFAVWQRNANGTGMDEQVYAVDSNDVSFTDVSRDGATAVVQVLSADNEDIWLLATATRKPEPFLSQPYNEMRGTLSPNGRYLAYESNETGRNEVYIRELGPAGGKWQISTDRGAAPRWRADGRELFYVSPDYDFVAVPIAYEHGLDIGTPVKLFTHRYSWSGIYTLVPYAPTSDGRHFYILAPTEQGGSAQFVVVQNWAEELKIRQ